MKNQMKKYLMIAVTILFALPAAQARPVSHDEALSFINKQVADISSLYSAGSISDEQAILMFEMSKNAFDTSMLTEYGLKYIKNQDKGLEKYNEDKVVQSFHSAFSRLKSGEINVSTFQSEVQKISQGTERPGN